MAKNLVIVESPAKAKTIEKFLGKDFKVESSFGHIADLPSKELGVDVEGDFKPKYEVSTDKKAVVSKLKTLAKKAEVVWLASDEDREGEAIAWHLAETLKIDKSKTKRIVFHEITKSAIENAVKKYAVQEHLNFGKIYAYEVDGFGNKLFMDDANVPSLMSLAYLDKEFKNSPLYTNTRKFLISENNPYFLKGSEAEGQASPHTGKDKIWPMGIILRAMTSTNDEEIKKCLKM